MKIDKYEKQVFNLYFEEKCVIHIRTLKHELYHDLILEKVDRVIEFN